MSKFCPNCGKALDDAVQFCDGCGAQQAVPQQPAKKSFDINKTVNEVKMVGNGIINRCKVDKPFMYKTLGVVAAVVVVLIVIIALLAGGGYKGAINTYIDYALEGKYKKLEKLAPKDYWNYLEDEIDDFDMDDLLDEAEDFSEATVEYFEDEYGDNYKVSYKIEDKKKLSDKKLEGIAEAMADAYDLDEDKFTDGYELELEVTVKGSEDDDDDEMDLTVIKYKGKWYPISWGKYNGKYYASFMVGE